MRCAGCGGPKGLSSCFLSPDLCARCDSEPQAREAADWFLIAGLCVAVVLIIAAAVAQ